jgi:hypothetical protein
MICKNRVLKLMKSNPRFSLTGKPPYTSFEYIDDSGERYWRHLESSFYGCSCVICEEIRKALGV